MMLKHVVSAVAGVALGFALHLGAERVMPTTAAAEIAKSCGRCGDGFCSSSCGENATTCPRDCSGETSVAKACGRCGDGSCVASCGEDANSCPKDCGGVES